MRNGKSGDSIMWGILGIFVLLLVLGFAFGFRQKMVKNFGGSMTIDLQPNTKLVNATWKDNNLWLLTTARSNEEPKTYNFSEKTSLGILQGNVTIVEK